MKLLYWIYDFLSKYYKKLILKQKMAEIDISEFFVS